MATYEDARKTQQHALRQLRSNHPEVSGLGIARIADGWGFKVNLRRPSKYELPPEVDGVPVVVEVTGRVVAATA